jgi:hypothetical protein
MAIRPQSISSPLSPASGGVAVAISPATGPVGTTFSVSLPTGATAQWTLNGAAISGATSSTYTSTTAGALGCLVTLPGATVSAVVTLAALVLSTTSFPYGVSSPTPLATISGKTAGSTVAIAASDTSGAFAVNTAGTQLLAGLNYGALAAGATPTVQLTETLAGAANSPNTTVIPVTVTNTTTVSASNRTRITAAQTAVANATKYYMARETHTTSVAVSGLQLTHANIITSANGESNGGYPLIMRAPVILTNIQGSLGGSGPLANQTGATLTKCTYAGLTGNISTRPQPAERPGFR